MLLEIRHRTQYRYATPVRECQMEARVRPPTTGRQRLLNFDLSVEPAAHLFSYSDVYGNTVHHFNEPQPHDQLTIRASSTVETNAAPPLASIGRDEWANLKGEGIEGEYFDFLQQQGFATPTEKLHALIAECGLDNPTDVDPLSAVRRLSERLYQGLSYIPGVTEADSPIDVAIEQRSGVCQDFAHIMIAVCRLWGVPARYVSGYLLAKPDSDRSRPDSSHAWVEVFLPSLRWVGLDPTNNLMVGERHVTLAVGRDYADVTPTRGVFKGDSESELFVAVSVRPVDQSSVEPELIRMSRPITSPQAAARPDAAYREYQQQQQQ